MNEKQNRAVNILMMAGIYILTALVGIGVFFLIGGELWLRLLLAVVASVCVVYIFGIVFDSSAVAKLFWGIMPIVMVTGVSMLHPINWINSIFMLVISFWGVRYATYWAYVYRDIREKEIADGIIKSRSRDYHTVVSFFINYLIPALVVYACTLPVVYVVDSEITFDIFSELFLAVALAAAAFQCVSDLQFQVFLQNGEKGFIRSGFWTNSRHPNDFGEIIMWCALAFAAVSAVGFKWYLLIGALINILYVIFVKIPIAEHPYKKNEDFRAYAAETRILIPVKRFDLKPAPAPEPEPEPEPIPEPVYDGPEVVGVVWPEKTRKNTVYRYDPNGFEINRGDIVLAPTFDYHSNREVERAAMVVYGNKPLDEATLRHPLKKIIRILKRADGTEIIDIPELEELEALLEEVAPEPEPEPVIIVVPEPEPEPEPEPIYDGPQVIDISWPEKLKKGVVYKYDPDGGVFNEGDVVLLPTRDVHGNREVIREAFVVKGNYPLDEGALKYPLKKVIKLVKRAEAQGKN